MHFLAQTSAHLLFSVTTFMPPFAAFSKPCTLPLRALVLPTMIACAVGLSACDPRPSGGSAIRFPGDSDISQALQANFAQDTDSAKARELIQTLGGEKGQLDYKVRKVIYRQGAFEARYDVSLRMGQSGAESLQKLYATMIPKEEAAKLPAQTLESYEKWLGESAQAMEKGNAQQAAALRHMLESLDQCYRNAKPSDSVALMDGLGALISPERNGWYADKLQSPQAQFRCLPL
jgi:hypothetical protein